MLIPSSWFISIYSGLLMWYIVNFKIINFLLIIDHKEKKMIGEN